MSSNKPLKAIVGGYSVCRLLVVLMAHNVAGLPLAPTATSDNAKFSNMTESFLLQRFKAELSKLHGEGRRLSDTELLSLEWAPEERHMSCTDVLGDATTKKGWKKFTALADAKSWCNEDENCVGLMQLAPVGRGAQNYYRRCAEGTKWTRYPHTISHKKFDAPKLIGDDECANQPSVPASMKLTRGFNIKTGAQQDSDGHNLGTVLSTALDDDPLRGRFFLGGACYRKLAILDGDLISDIKTTSFMGSMAKATVQDYASAKATQLEQSYEIDVEASAEASGFGVSGSVSVAAHVAGSESESVKFSKASSKAATSAVIEFSTTMQFAEGRVAAPQFDSDYLHQWSLLSANSNQQDWEKLWTRYGTHVVESFLLGGNLQMVYMMEKEKKGDNTQWINDKKTDLSRKLSVSASIEGSYGVASGSASVSASVAGRQFEARQKQGAETSMIDKSVYSCTTIATGGIIGPADCMDQQAFAQGSAAWAASLTGASAVLPKKGMSIISLMRSKGDGDSPVAQAHRAAVLGIDQANNKRMYTELLRVAEESLWGYLNKEYDAIVSPFPFTRLDTTVRCPAGFEQVASCNQCGQTLREVKAAGFFDGYPSRLVPIFYDEFEREEMNVCSYFKTPWKSEWDGDVYCGDQSAATFAAQRPPGNSAITLSRWQRRTYYPLCKKGEGVGHVSTLSRIRAWRPCLSKAGPISMSWGQTTPIAASCPATAPDDNVFSVSFDATVSSYTNYGHFVEYACDYNHPTYRSFGIGLRDGPNPGVCSGTKQIYFQVSQITSYYNLAYLCLDDNGIDITDGQYHSIHAHSTGTHIYISVDGHTSVGSVPSNDRGVQASPQYGRFDCGLTSLKLGSGSSSSRHITGLMKDLVITTGRPEAP